MDEPAKMSDTIAQPALGIEEKRNCVPSSNPATRLARIADVLDVEIEKPRPRPQHSNPREAAMERAQKEYYLNERFKPFKGTGRGEKSEFDGCARRSKPPNAQGSARQAIRS